jgi:hypothetical protein
LCLPLQLCPFIFFVQYNTEAKMLVYGRVNPPPSLQPASVYLNVGDDMQALAASLRDKPLLTEHKDRAKVGRIINAWTHPRDGCMYMLAEIDESSPAGAVAATCVERKLFTEFSLGYRLNFSNNQLVGSKHMIEASLVKQGARPGCKLLHWSRSAAFPPTSTVANFDHFAPLS